MLEDDEEIARQSNHVAEVQKIVSKSLGQRRKFLFPLQGVGTGCLFPMGLGPTVQLRQKVPVSDQQLLL